MIMEDTFTLNERESNFRTMDADSATKLEYFWNELTDKFVFVGNEIHSRMTVEKEKLKPFGQEDTDRPEVDIALQLDVDRITITVKSSFNPSATIDKLSQVTGIDDEINSLVQRSIAVLRDMIERDQRSSNHEKGTPEQAAVDSENQERKRIINAYKETDYNDYLEDDARIWQARITLLYRDDDKPVSGSELQARKEMINRLSQVIVTLELDLDKIQKLNDRLKEYIKLVQEG